MGYFSVTAGRYIHKARVTKALKEAAGEAGISIIRAKPGDYRKIGIHLLEAEQFELEKAIEDAGARGFPAIYLHTFKTWRTDKPRNTRPVKLILIQGWKS